MSAVQKLVEAAKDAVRCHGDGGHGACAECKQRINEAIAAVEAEAAAAPDFWGVQKAINKFYQHTSDFATYKEEDAARAALVAAIKAYKGDGAMEAIERMVADCNYEVGVSRMSDTWNAWRDTPDVCRQATGPTPAAAILALAEKVK